MADLTDGVVGISSTNVETPEFSDFKKTLPQEPEGDVKKLYAVVCHNGRDWRDIHRELIKENSLEDYVPTQAIGCFDGKEHSQTRGVYSLTESEASELRKNSKVKDVSIDTASYPGTYKPDPLHLMEAINYIPRYSSDVKNYRALAVPTTPTADDYNRSGFQLLRSQFKDNPWGSNVPSIVNDKLGSYGDGKDVDVVVADQACWFGHIEFQNKTDSGDVDGPINYVGGNVLPGNGSCDVLDLVMDAPYYIDPAWFDADPATLMTRWDGTVVPQEQNALAWWSDPTKRSAQFANIGTVSVSNYTRDRCNGSNVANHTSGIYDFHGTPCASQAYGRQYGYAYNANKWYIDAYGAYGTGVEQYFDILKLFHLHKPNNPSKGNTKDPTVSSNSFGYRKDLPNTGYYYHRSGTNGHTSLEYSVDVTSSTSSGGGSPSNYSISVTNSGASAYVLNGTDSNGSVSGNNATISCVAGDTIDFNVSVGGHPFWIKTVSQTGSSGGASGVTNNGSQSGTVSFTPSAAGTYYYICQYHGGMVGTITVASSGGGLVYALSGTDKAGNVSGNNPTITMNNYDTITFNVNASGPDHPFYIKTSPGTGIGNQATGVTGQGATNSAVTFTPTSAGTYYYQCEYHGNMVGTINVGSGTPAGVQYTSLPQFMNNFSQTSIRFEYVGNSMVTAGDEMIDAGVIFVCSSGNTNQKLVKADHPDYNNYWATSPDTAYANAYTTYYGYLAYNSINRQGFPGQIGKLGSGSNSLYRTIPVGALDDFLFSTTGTGQEQKADYSNMGNLISFYACADNTLSSCDDSTAAYSGSAAEKERYDKYYTLNGQQSHPSYDRFFNGTSSACPVAAGIIATKVQYNRNWDYSDINNWLTTSVGTQSSSALYAGNDSSTPNASGTGEWTDNKSIQGGDPIILWDAPTGNEPGASDSQVKLNITNASGLNISGVNIINT